MAKVTVLTPMQGYILREIEDAVRGLHERLVIHDENYHEGEFVVRIRYSPKGIEVIPPDDTALISLSTPPPPASSERTVK